MQKGAPNVASGPFTAPALGETARPANAARSSPEKTAPNENFSFSSAQVRTTVSSPPESGVEVGGGGCGGDELTSEIRDKRSRCQ